jgi:hypothetical protein
MNQFGLGFRVKSGHAIAVALRGPGSAPAVLARLVVELSDPAVPAIRQLYHEVAVLGKTHGRTWRAEEKAACIAAWLALRQ